MWNPQRPPPIPPSPFRPGFRASPGPSAGAADLRLHKAHRFRFRGSERGRLRVVIPHWWGLPSSFQGGPLAWKSRGGDEPVQRWGQATFLLLRSVPGQTRDIPLPSSFPTRSRKSFSAPFAPLPGRIRNPSPSPTHTFPGVPQHLNPASRGAKKTISPCLPRSPTPTQGRAPPRPWTCSHTCAPGEGKPGIQGRDNPRSGAGKLRFSPSSTAELLRKPWQPRRGRGGGSVGGPWVGRRPSLGVVCFAPHLPPKITPLKPLPRPSPSPEGGGQGFGAHTWQQLPGGIFMFPFFLRGAGGKQQHGTCGTHKSPALRAARAPGRRCSFP